MKFGAWTVLTIALFMVVATGLAGPAAAGEYVHQAPAFTVTYPDSFESVPPRKEIGQVFSAKTAGSLPTFQVSVLKVQEGVKLADACQKVYVEILKKGSEDVNLISNKPAKLADGTPAYESKIIWNYMGLIDLETLVLNVYKDKKHIIVAVHDREAVERLRGVIEGLKFK